MEAPDLFLKLASLYEEPNFEEAALVFSRKFGLPGGSSSEKGGRPDGMHLSGFRKECKRAWVILRMYEAALNQDQEAASRMFSTYVNEFSDAVQRENVEEHYMVIFVLASSFVANTAGELCRPAISITETTFSQPQPDASWVKSAWQFDNLLGAAYLQMYWLMTSAGDLAHCEYCGQTISLARSRPAGRKRRRDKRFCDDACRQAHHRSRKKT